MRWCRRTTARRRISSASGSAATSPSPDPIGSAFVDRSGFGRGLRLSSEFVFGVLFGAVLGWFFDRWLKTSPGGLIVFTLLGFVGAIVHLVRISSRGPGGAGNGKLEGPQPK